MTNIIITDNTQMFLRMERERDVVPGLVIERYDMLKPIPPAVSLSHLVRTIVKRMNSNPHFRCLLIDRRESGSPMAIAMACAAYYTSSSLALVQHHFNHFYAHRYTNEARLDQFMSVTKDMSSMTDTHGACTENGVLRYVPPPPLATATHASSSSSSSSGPKRTAKSQTPVFERARSSAVVGGRTHKQSSLASWSKSSASSDTKDKSEASAPTTLSGNEVRQKAPVILPANPDLRKRLEQIIEINSQTTLVERYSPHTTPTHGCLCPPNTTAEIVWQSTADDTQQNDDDDARSAYWDTRIEMPGVGSVVAAPDEDNEGGGEHVRASAHRKRPHWYMRRNVDDEIGEEFDNGFILDSEIHDPIERARAYATTVELREILDAELFGNDNNGEDE